MLLSLSEDSRKPMTIAGLSILTPKNFLLNYRKPYANILPKLLMKIFSMNFLEIITKIKDNRHWKILRKIMKIYGVNSRLNKISSSKILQLLRKK
jgi:hypothetical protein